MVDPHQKLKWGSDESSSPPFQPCVDSTTHVVDEYYGKKTIQNLTIVDLTTASRNEMALSENRVPQNPRLYHVQHKNRPLGYTQFSGTPE